jgi:hypothetical protein
VRDVRYGMRALLRSPGFALVAVVSLSLGIGVNTTIFSVANAVLYRPLPFDDPDRLVLIYEQHTKRESQRLPPLSTMIEWQEQARSFEQIEGIVEGTEANTLSGGGAAERVRIQFLTPGAFSLLGVKPARGRVFTSEDAVPREPLADHQRRAVAAPIWGGSRRARANHPCGRRPGTGCGRDAGWHLDGALDAKRRHMETG